MATSKTTRVPPSNQPEKHPMLYTGPEMAKNHPQIVMNEIVAVLDFMSDAVTGDVVCDTSDGYFAVSTILKWLAASLEAAQEELDRRDIESLRPNPTT